ncbi:MAG: molybdopterin-dependent oxidoreductase [Pseudonocardiaceae bacterium]
MRRHRHEKQAAGLTIATDLRSGLTRGDDVVDVATWAGSVPAATGVAPRVRFGSRWFNLLWLLPLGFVLLLVAVAVAKGLRHIPVMAEFIARYPGTATTDLPDTVGIPGWARWQHFLNLLLMIFILRSGLQILRHHLTMLAYDMNDEPLSFGHGAPLRLRNEIELGFKMVKWIKGIEFVADFHDIGSGYGGYNQDHEFFGYRQAL